MPLIGGDDGRNVLSGTEANDTILGFGGDDELSGLGGDDSIDGGAGSDLLGQVLPYIPGEFGDDIYIGGPGDDRIGAGAGNDTVFGGEGNDRIFADSPVSPRGIGAGNDWISGGPGSDSISGALGFDVAYFELPRRAYAVQAGRIPFPQTNAENPDTLPTEGVAVTLRGGAETDFLVGIEELRFVDGRVATYPDDAVARVYRVYEAGLDRAPDPIGLNFWGAQVATGVPLGAFADAVVQSAEFQGRYGALDNTAYVQRLYLNVLGRPGEASGVDGWVAALNAGSTRGDVLAGFADSRENIVNTAGVLAVGIWDQDERAAQVSRLYDAAFNRLPDLAGFLVNKAALDAGRSLEQLARDFTGTAEFAALYAGPDAAPRALVDALYHNALDRPADAAGLAHWTGQLQSGALTREQVIVAFSESLEHQILALPSIEGGVVFT